MRRVIFLFIYFHYGNDFESFVMFLFNVFCYSIQVTIKGVVLLNVSLSREVVPAFARILLRTALGKKHLVRPLLRTEITQVVNRRAWYDATKLTTDVLSLYKVCPGESHRIFYFKGVKRKSVH